ncbi:MAG TPA: Lrp/AsnC family transcriptional regulator [Saprospiraceae bacterium]|nr:Lrp/AsnC family transcriptional regulator [Saprospiraceae bacterium]
MKALDDIDFHILRIFQQDAYVSIKDLAQKIDLSFTPTYERVKKLREEGYIKKYVALCDREKLGFGIMVYCNIVLKEQSKKALLNFERDIAKLPQVLEIYAISGNYDYMLKILAQDITDYNNFIVNKIAELPNIGQYHSFFVMKEVKNDPALPV